MQNRATVFCIINLFNNMKVEDEDLGFIAEIIATRYFMNQGWKFTNLRESEKILSAKEEVEEQYERYPYMDKNWYVSNLVSKNFHLCETWNELKKLVEFLEGFKQNFNFIMRVEGKITLCLINQDDKDKNMEVENAISAAKTYGYSVYTLNIEIPNDVKFNLTPIFSPYK